jgi:hypothetical protein
LKTSRFQQITVGQARRIIRNAPHAMMLLYDYDEVPIQEPVRDLLLSVLADFSFSPDNYPSTYRTIVIGGRDRQE